jgi:hypothetical protein
LRLTSVNFRVDMEAPHNRFRHARTPMPPNLTDEQREQATATANLVAAAMARLQREHGDAAVMEAMRLISSAMSSDERRKSIAQALLDNSNPPTDEDR